MKSCACNSGIISSWYDLQDAAPKNPFDIIAYAELDSTEGAFAYSPDYLNSGGSWTATPITVRDAGKCNAWETDNLQKVADASMWSQQHQVTNAATDLAIPLRKKVFVRGGTAWKMEIPLSFSVGLDDLQISFLDNAGTRGDAQGTVPVLGFSIGAPFSSGNHTLYLTLKSFGEVTLGLYSLATTSGDQAMMELDLIIVP